MKTIELDASTKVFDFLRSDLRRNARIDYQLDPNDSLSIVSFEDGLPYLTASLRELAYEYNWFPVIMSKGPVSFDNSRGFFTIVIFFSKIAKYKVDDDFFPRPVGEYAELLFTQYRHNKDYNWLCNGEYVCYYNDCLVGVADDYDCDILTHNNGYVYRIDYLDGYGAKYLYDHIVEMRLKHEEPKNPA